MARLEPCRIGLHKQRLDILDLKAQKRGLYIVESEVSKIRYIYDDGCIALVTGTGYVKMTEEFATKVMDEMKDILEDIRQLKSMGCQE